MSAAPPSPPSRQGAGGDPLTDPSEPPPRARPHIREILRPRDDEADDAISRAGAVIGPVLVIAAIGAALVGPVGFLAGIGLLALASGALSLAWRPGGSAARARSATAVAAVLLGVAAAGFGFLANPCVAEPIAVAAVSLALFEGTLLGSISVGRSLALSGGLFAPLVIAGGIALVGFFVSVFLVGAKVFVLC